MQTSNFARAFAHPNAVATSAGIPRNFRGRVLKQLAPPWSLVKAIKNGQITEDEYRIRYSQILAQLDPQEVFDQVGPDGVMLCFCAPGEFCHRRILAEWLEDALKVKVPEMA